MKTNMEESTISINDPYECPKIIIVVLNWNNYEDTSECLCSLEDIDYPRYDIVVVDNGSSDGSGSRLEEDFPNVDVLFNSENKGFAAGNNVGINFALESNADYILLLNNDTVVGCDFLTQLVRTAESNKNAAIVGGIIYEADSDNIWFSGASFIPSLVKSRHYTSIQQEAPYETDYVTGAMMLLRAGFLNQVGNLNEDYFFGYEDVDISFEARKRDRDVLITPTSEIYHKVGNSAGNYNPFRYYHSTWNRLKFANNHLSISQRYFFYIFFVLTRFFRIVQWTVSRSVEQSRSKAVLQGLFDFFRGSRPNYEW